MTTPPLQFRIDGSLATITFNDPDRRNALSIAMFDALDDALRQIDEDDNIIALLVHGNGKAFCAGFDLGAVVEEPALMGTFIHRLSAVNKRLRRMPAVVVAAVHGAAIAGGCALVSACDIVIASRSAKLGYPVHRIGVSPAVSLPTLQQAVPPGAARAMMMGGELISGEQAHRLGLIWQLVESDHDVLPAARELCAQLLRKGPHALRVTKHWLNELDGSLQDDAFTATADGSAELALHAEAVNMLQVAWRKR